MPAQRTPPLKPHAMPRWLILAGVLILAVVPAGQTEEQEAQQELRNGEKISTALATVTRTAISPLLGVCVIGGWRYYHTPRAVRNQLPLIQKPKFWILTCCEFCYFTPNINPIPTRTCLLSPPTCARCLGGLTDGFTLARIAPCCLSTGACWSGRRRTYWSASHRVSKSARACFSLR